MATRIVEFAGQEFTAETLTDQERELLFHDVFERVASGNSFLLSLFKSNEQSILAAAEIAKAAFDTNFNGVLPADAQFGVGLIRPGHILRSTATTETPVNTWDSDAIQSGAFTAGVDNWIGYGANNATAANIDKDALLLIMGVQFLQGNAPVVLGVRFVIGERTYPVFSLTDAWSASNEFGVRAVRIPPLLAKPRATVAAQVITSVAGRQEMQLLGLTFARGSFLRELTYTRVNL